MTVTLQIPFETLVELAKQLPPDKKADLIAHLQGVSQQRELTKEERLALFEATIRSHPVNQEPSIRREDWYDDDGR